MELKKKIRTIKTLSTIIIVVITLFGCSTNSTNVSKHDIIKPKMSKNIPAELRGYVEKLNSEKSSEKIYGVRMLGKAGREAFPAVPHLLALMESDDLSVKMPVMSALGKIGSHEAVDPLIAILKDRSSPLRAEAAKVLGQLADARAIDELAARLTDKTILDRAVRENSAWALGEIKDQHAIEHLITALKEEPVIVAAALNKIDANWKNSEIAYDAIYDLISQIKKAASDEYISSKLVAAISMIGKNAIDPLIALLTDKDVYVRKNAATALNNIRWAPTNQAKILYLIAAQEWDALLNYKEEAQPYLVKMLVDSDKDVRTASARTLDKLNWGPSFQSESIDYLIASQSWDELIEKRDLAVSALVAMLKDHDPYIHEKVSMTLVMIGEPSVAPLIYALGDKSMFTKSSAVSILNKIDDEWRSSTALKKAIHKFIIELIDNEDKEVKASVAWALGEIGDPVAIEPLVDALKDEDHGVRLYVAKALGRIGDSRSIQPLLVLLEDNDSAVRGYVARALGDIKSQDAIEPLLIVLRDRDSWPRESAKIALNRIDPNWAISEAAKHSVQDFIANLENEDINVQQSAAKALGDIKDVSAVQPLIEKLNDENEGISSAAARSLGKIGDRTAVKALVEALENDLSHAPAITYALAKIKDPRSVKPLIAVLEDESARSYIVRALEKITGERFGEDWLLWQQWWENKCKQGAEYCAYVESGF